MSSASAQSAPVTWLEHPQGRVRLEQLPGGGRRVTVAPGAPGTSGFVSRAECVTSYGVDLIARILDVKTPAYLCDEILRDEDPRYVELFLRHGLLAYVSEDGFRDARLLDFGSGSGASTVILARMLPHTHIVGVELEPDFIDIARMRAAHHGCDALEFRQSPDASRLPGDIGSFAFVNLGAVYEHLLPAERRRLIPQLWSLLDVGGTLFVNQLPHRWYPHEHHTTGLPLINYLPDSAARLAATRLSARVDRQATWEQLLRAGIRGATAGEIRQDIARGAGRCETLIPSRMGLHDHAGLWYACSSQARPHRAKRVMRSAFRLLSAGTGTSFAPGLTLAFRKLG